MMNYYKLNEKGIALVTTLLMGLIAMGLVAIAFFLATTSTEMSGIEKRYITELDAAKGAAQYIMTDLRAGILKCNGGNPCIGDTTCASVGSVIDLNSNVCNGLGKPACANISACYLNETSSTDFTLISVSITSTNPTFNEQATVDFVYRIE
ncbi:MAG: hypothetical protein OEY01_14985 [Desulfobulbaceae bacterium]|nr:hypothetical protein [Desulfobulbaceae bacterium]HIJ79892.1 hypothetical protein [Deltaproteobacteria bacterium]